MIMSSLPGPSSSPGRSSSESLLIVPSHFPSARSYDPFNSSLPGLPNNVAPTMQHCIESLGRAGIDPFPPPELGLWCNATWDTVLCWPPTPANTSVTLPCPPLKGLDPNKNITKACHWSSRWMGRNETDFGRDHGWTNFTMCYTDEVIYIMEHLTNGSLSIAQDVAKNARKLEFVGLGLSLISLVVSICIFSYFRRLRVFRNLLHLHLMVAILMVVIIRLILYVDLIFTDRLGPQQNHGDGRTINTMVFVCEAMYFLLEYFKSVAFEWMFLEGFYLHNQLVLTVFSAEPRLQPYLIAGYGLPLLHTSIWLLALLYKKDFKVERCLGSYYLEPEFWILDGPRLLELVINSFFIFNVIRVLWSKVRGESHNTSELALIRKSVKAALMLIPLLGIPNIMQTIPFSPTKDNIMIFAIWTYCASFTYMYQGLMISIIYCFTNREVNTVIKAFYSRYRLQHTTSTELRRGSRTIPSNFQTKNGTKRKSTSTQANTIEEDVTTVIDQSDMNGSSKLSPFMSTRSKKGSGDSTARLVLPTTTEEYTVGNNNVNGTPNGYGTTEWTPLRGEKGNSKKASNARNSRDRSAY
ncbi:unnamed protein product, partial [Mesorhabditis belari]|uniref:Calcitonin receptor n=1 Tax=Mesorhabditis belari TaxID=2138241 RepID=A0AAF3E9I4_9BILA